MFLEHAYLSWERDALKIHYHANNELERDVKRVLVVLAAGTSLVPHMSIENSEYREIGKVIVHPSANERIHVGVFRDASIQREYVADSRGRLVFEGQLE